MSLETTVFTFKISFPYEEWAAVYDSEENIKMMKEIRESGYDKKLVHNYIRELLDSEKRKFPKENNNLELIDNYLLDKDPQEVSKNGAEILMAAELLDNYLLDKRFMRDLEDREEYDAA